MASTDLPEATVEKPEEGEKGAFAPPPEETPEPEKKAKKTRKPREKKEKRFVVASEEGVVVCEESSLPEALEGRTDPEVFLVEKKVKSIKVVPGEVDLLSGEKGATSIEIKYE